MSRLPHVVDEDTLAHGEKLRQRKSRWAIWLAGQSPSAECLCQRHESAGLSGGKLALSPGNSVEAWKIIEDFGDERQKGSWLRGAMLPVVDRTRHATGLNLLIEAGQLPPSLELWHTLSMATPITTLELRTIQIPRSPTLAIIERELGRAITEERRHFLAGQPVHCGDFLEYFDNGQWILGRYEWTCISTEPAMLKLPDRVIKLTGDCLLRWPK